MQFGLISNYKFFKDYKVHLPHSSCNFVVLKNLLERINTKLHTKSCYNLYSLTTIFSSKLRKINQCIAANLIPRAGYRNINLTV